MKTIVGYLQDFFRHTNIKLTLTISLFAATLIFLNYYFRLYITLYAPADFLPRFAGFFFLFTFVFSFSYLLGFLLQKKSFPTQPIFYILIIAAPAIFALKISFTTPLQLFSGVFSYPWDQYWKIVLQWPLKGIMACGLVLTCWFAGRYGRPIAGLSFANISVRPYFLALAVMIPFITLAGTAADFQQAYPKLSHIDFIDGYTQQPWLPRIFFELCYGLDFFTIEFFFRGFLTLAFVRYAGKDAILPMAVFYCTIHFGKPLAECISSYFGGIILGVIIYHTRSVWGGLIAHLGIAWLMEIAGYLL